MQLSKISLELIAEYIKESRYLENLDLSWNNLIPSDFAVVFDVIQTNPTLKSLNLSCNTIIDKQFQNNSVNWDFSSAFDVLTNLKKEAIKAGNTGIAKDEPADMPMKVISCLGRFIRYNKNLQSLILNNCGLNSQVMVGFVSYLRHAKSLLCLHMASNPGITE